MSRLLKYAAPLAAAAYGVAYPGIKQGIRSYISGRARAYTGRAVKRMSRMLRRGNGRSGTFKMRAVTQQHDVRNQGRYVGRRGKGWRRFRARVRAAIQADNPRHIYQAVYKSAGSTADSIAGFDGVYLLDFNTTNQGDLFNIFKDLGAASAADCDNYKAYIRSATMDFMITNKDTTNPCEVDVFECVARRDDNQTGTPGSLWNAYFADMDAVGTVNAGHPGLTPFTVANFSRSWKVVNTTKYLIEPGKTVSMSVRLKLNKVINGLRLANSITIGRGITKMVFFRVRGIASNTTPTAGLPASGLTGWSVAWSAITNINYQALPTPDQTEDIDQSK